MRTRPSKLLVVMRLANQGAAEEYPAGHSFAMPACLEELWPTAELVVTAREAPEELRTFLRQRNADEPP